MRLKLAAAVVVAAFHTLTDAQRVHAVVTTFVGILATTTQTSATHLAVKHGQQIAKTLIVIS
jgi:hypothetical protein